MFLTNNFILENNFLINYLFPFFLFLIYFSRDYIVDNTSKVQINISISEFRLVNHGFQSETYCQISEILISAQNAIGTCIAKTLLLQTYVCKWEECTGILEGTFNYPFNFYVSFIQIPLSFHTKLVDWFLHVRNIN